MTSPLTSALVAATLLAGCDRAPIAPAEPPLPPPTLEPAVPQLERIVAAAPQPPSDAAELAELRELLSVAFLLETSNAHLAAMAKAHLDESPAAQCVLEEGLEHAEPAVRRRAAFELGIRGRRSAVPLLLMRVKYETKDRAARVWVAGALARLHDDAALYDLIDGMKDQETAEAAGREAIEVLKAAGRSVGDEPTWGELEQGLVEVYREWRKTGVAPGADSAAEPDALLRARVAQHLLDLERFDLRKVDDARFVLGRMGSSTLSLLRIGLHASEDYIRQHTAEIVLSLEKVAAPLKGDVLPLLGDRLVEPTAVRALGAMQANDALPHLLARLHSDDPELRVAAIEAVGLLGAKEAVEPLRLLLRAQDSAIDERVMAAFSLGMLEGGGEGVAFLEQARDAGSYHEPTLRELLDRLAAHD